MNESSSESGHPVPLAARRHQLIHEIRRGLRMTCGGEDPGHLVLAVSGGRDSLALLIAAVVLREQDDCAILPRVVHVHHHLRPEADSEANHVVEVATRLDVPSEVRHVEVPDATPAQARRVRYKRSSRPHVIVVPLWSPPVIMRGSIGDHHRGPRSRGRTSRSCRHVAKATSRSRRAQIRQCSLSRVTTRGSVHGGRVDWCDDPGNTDVATQRGRLRRDVLPVLESMWPGVATESRLWQSAIGCSHGIGRPRVIRLRSSRPDPLGSSEALDASHGGRHDGSQKSDSRNRSIWIGFHFKAIAGGGFRWNRRSSDTSENVRGRCRPGCRGRCRSCEG